MVQGRVQEKGYRREWVSIVKYMGSLLLEVCEQIMITSEIGSSQRSLYEEDVLKEIFIW